MRKKSSREKGFIGPIGDDLPSLIPIIFSLVIFFSTFTTSFVTFDDGNTRFDHTIKILKISNEMRGDKYLNSVEEFFDLCDGLSVRGVNYQAAIVELNEQGAPFEEFELFEFVNNDLGVFEAIDVSNCTDPNDFSTCAKEKLVCASSNEEMFDNSEAIKKIFPVAFQDVSNDAEFAVRPMLLVVVVWF